MERTAAHEPDFYERFFGVITRPQTYRNLGYVALAFPLGLFYFNFLIVGLSLGVSLAIIWVGLPILALMFFAWQALVSFERALATKLLGVSIPAPRRVPTESSSLMGRIGAQLRDPVAWKGLVYLFLRFPLGIVSFVALVTWFSLTAALIGTPFIYEMVSVQVGMRVIGSMNEALFAAFIGVWVGFGGLHVLNGIAAFSGSLAKAMLSGSPAPDAPLPFEGPAVAKDEAEVALR